MFRMPILCSILFLRNSRILPTSVAFSSMPNSNNNMPNLRLAALLDKAVALRETSSSSSSPLDALIDRIQNSMFTNDYRIETELEELFLQEANRVQYPSTEKQSSSSSSSSWETIVSMGNQIQQAAREGRDVEEIDQMVQNYWNERSNSMYDSSQDEYYANAADAQVQQVNEQLLQLQQVRQQMEASILGDNLSPPRRKTATSSYQEYIDDRDYSYENENEARIREIDAELLRIQQQRAEMEGILNGDSDTLYNTQDDFTQEYSGISRLDDEIDLRQQRIDQLNAELEEMDKARQVLQTQMVSKSPDEPPPLFSAMGPPLFLNIFRRRVDPSLRREPESFQKERSRRMNQPLSVEAFTEKVTREAKAVLQQGARYDMNEPSSEAPSLEFLADIIEKQQQDSGLKTTILSNLDYLREDIETVSSLASSFSENSVKIVRGGVETARKVLSTGVQLAISTTELLDAVKEQISNPSRENPEDQVGEYPSISELWSDNDASLDYGAVDEDLLNVSPPRTDILESRGPTPIPRPKLPSRPGYRTSPRSPYSWQDLSKEWEERNRDQSTEFQNTIYLTNEKEEESDSQVYLPRDKWRQSAAEVGDYLMTLQTSWSQRQDELETSVSRTLSPDSSSSNWEVLAKEWTIRNTSEPGNSSIR